jgi:uncharacterized damage-inducible protein DinB
MAGELESQLTASQLSARLQTSRAELMAAITGLDDTALRARTTSGVWTPVQLLAHLLSTERIFIERARKTVEQDHYVVTPVSGDVREEHLGMAKRMPVPQIVHGLLAQRRDTLQFVESLTRNDLERKLSHPVRGEQTALWQIEHVIEHEQEHAQEIRARRAAAEPEGAIP